MQGNRRGFFGACCTDDIRFEFVAEGYLTRLRTRFPFCPSEGVAFAASHRPWFDRSPPERAFHRGDCLCELQSVDLQRVRCDRAVERIAGLEDLGDLFD